MVAKKLPIIISIPHGGVVIPEPVKKICRLDRQQILRDGDTWAQYLYNFGSGVTAAVVAEAARVVIDMNRNPGDLPPENPDGVVKTISVLKEQVWEKPEGLSREMADTLIFRYHKPYHEQIEKLCRLHKIAMGFDCHTMLDRDPTSKEVRPMICISNNGGKNHGEKVGDNITATPALILQLKAKLEKLFASEGADYPSLVGINFPFRGGYIIKQHSSLSSLPWIQLEINRKMYLSDRNMIPEKPDQAARHRMDDIRSKIFLAIRDLL